MVVVEVSLWSVAVCVVLGFWTLKWVVFFDVGHGFEGHTFGRHGWSWGPEQG